MHVSERVLSYYRGAYQDENALPDLSELKKMLEDGEQVEVYNPFFQDDPEFWLFHENMLTHADLEHVLPPFSDTEIGRHARSAVGILVSFGCVFPEYEGRDIDDVEFAVTESLLFGEYENYGVSSEKAITVATSNGLIKPSFREALIELRKVLEKERHPSIGMKIRKVAKSASENMKMRKITKEKKRVAQRILSKRAKKDTNQD